MTIAMTREQAAAAVAAATAERDGIQANLLELDDSFGKRLLDGATLAGESKQRWEAAAADLAALWEVFTAYAAAVDRATELLARARRAGSPELAEITTLLTGASVGLTRAPVPLAQRDLTDRGRADLTPAAAVAEMKRAFASVTEVVAAAESVWTETGDGLSEIGTALGAAKEQAGDLGDEELTGALAAAGGDLARLRADAQRRIATVTAAVTAAVAAWQDARAARERAAAKIATALPPPAEAAGLDTRLAALDTLRAAGRWAQLAAELDAIGAEAAAALERYRGAERTAVALLGKRDELRGLLDAYQAKAARLGAAEDAELTARYQQARELLWTAPCDLAAASAAVTDYQQAILALGGRRQPR